MCATYAPRDPVGEFWRGEISLRTLRVLVDGLPPDSPVHRKLDESRGWTVTDYLLADVWDALNALVMLQSGQYEKPPQYPPPRERPGDKLAREAERVRAQREARASREWVSNIERITGVGR